MENREQLTAIQWVKKFHKIYSDNDDYLCQTFTDEIIAFNAGLNESDQQNKSLQEEVERLKEVLKQVNIYFHQEVLMDDSYNGIWRDSEETIIENIKNVLSK